MDYRLWIDGKWADSKSGKKMAIENPAMGEKMAEVFDASKQDVGRAIKLSAELEFGTVWVNDYIPLTSESPHGGLKQSGFGKDLSAEAVGDYQITKHVMVSNSER